MKVQVYRTGASSYQDSSFLKKEQMALEKIPGVKYINSLKETLKDVPFILITNTHTNVNDIPQMILKKTALMIHPNSGHDNIYSDFVQNVDFPIVIGNPIRANAVVEYVLGCLFKEFAPIANHTHWQQNRTWDRLLLRDQKVLILGHGHIGKLLNQSLSPLVKDLTVYDPFIKTNLPHNIKQDFAENLFSDVNVLIIAANLNPTTHHMINRGILNKLAPKALIINPARGEIIQEKELINFLQLNPMTKCYLDVFETEPFAPGYQSKLSNLNKTSHIAGVFKDLNADIISFEETVIKDFVANHIGHFQRDNFKEYYSENIIHSDPVELRVL